MTTRLESREQLIEKITACASHPAHASSRARRRAIPKDHYIDLQLLDGKTPVCAAPLDNDRVMVSFARSRGHLLLLRGGESHLVRHREVQPELVADHWPPAFPWSIAWPPHSPEIEALKAELTQVSRQLRIVRSGLRRTLGLATGEIKGTGKTGRPRRGAA